MFKFKVRSDDGETLEFPAGTRDIAMWEKTTPGASMAKLLSDLKVTDMYKIAHLAARRQQLYTGSLAEFENTFDIVSELMTIEEQPDPTQPEASNGLSSLSPSEQASPQTSGSSTTSG
jgi:hypothetical protein